MSGLWEHVGMEPLIPERSDVEKLREKLEELGWEDGRKYGLEEHMLLETIIHDGLFEEAFERLNEHALRDLTPAERYEVLSQVKELLRNATEEMLLEYLKHGVDITVKREKRTFILIDFENLGNNTFVYAHELKFPGSPENIKPDFTLLVNGIPLAIIEVKPSTRIGSEDEALKQIRRYEQQSPDLFRLVQLGVAYGHRKLFVPTFPNWEKEERFIPGQPWKVKKEVDGKIVKVEDIHHLLRPDVLLEVIRWFTFFRSREGVKDKIIARYNQFTATKEVLKRIYDYLSGGEKNKGLIWHWQGSGKTYTMFFIANRFFEEFFERNPLVFFIVDRRELQDQLKRFLEGLRAPKFKAYLKVVESIEELKEVIRQIRTSEYKQGIIARGIYIALIQKFRRKEFDDLLEGLGREYLDYIRQNRPEEYERVVEELAKLPPDERRIKLMELGGIRKREILLLIDEAHRSQYGLLASVMKNVFLNAMRFAFTGTPVFKFERNTFEEFAYPPGEYYLDVYFVGDSIDDGFTLPIAYDVVQEGEPLFEGIRILLNDEEIRDYIEGWLKMSEEGGGSAADDVESILEGRPVVTRSDILRHLNKVRVFLTNERRLEKLAEYIAKRLEEDTEGFKFKAMVVAANRKACVILKRYLDEKLRQRYGDKAKDWVEVVMTYQHNDTGEILKYKEELTLRKGTKDTDKINMEIRDEFKEKENPKVLIVTDMLITGFDAPKLKVMYLDKPLYEHRLLQAIARVNRPYEDEVIKKEIGLVVDSVGLLRHLRESLRKYELIARGDIVSDLEENLLSRVEERFEEFKQTLRDTKELLKSLRIKGRDLGIDIDRVKEAIETDKRTALELMEEVDRKLRVLAAFWDMVEVQRVLNLMYDTIQLFKAIGSHRGKMHYAMDVKIIAHVYGKLLYYIKGRRLPEEFWEGLIRLIHERTLVEDFRKLISTVITDRDLKSMLDRLKEIRASEIIPEREVADAYRMLKVLLEQLPQNPIYREIRERIEKARIDWLLRNIDITAFLDLLVSSIEDKLKYDEKIASMSVEDRIAETVRTLIMRRYGLGEETRLELAKFRKTLSEVVAAPRIVSRHEKDITTALMLDLFRELKDKHIPARELKELAKEVTKDYILKEIARSKQR